MLKPDPEFGGGRNDKLADPIYLKQSFLIRYLFQKVLDIR